MRISLIPCKLILPLALGVAAWTGCESTDGGASVGGGVYYGVGYDDPWYYGGDWDDPDIIVTPPGDRPGSGAHPEHPIARPAPAPAPRPMPAIPSAPRPSFRR
jgi:hypothetical protein